MSRLQSVNFFLTDTEACSYLPKEKASFLVLDPTEKISASEFSQLSQSGFRRSGKTIYRPQCKSCDQCIPIRIPVENFIPKRRHRRVLRKNSRVSVSKVNPFFRQNISVSIPNTLIIVTILTIWTLHQSHNIKIF